VERLEAPLDVFVTNYVMRTTDDATGATCAQARGNYFIVKFFPLKGPTFAFRCFGAFFS